MSKVTDAIIGRLNSIEEKLDQVLTNYGERREESPSEDNTAGTTEETTTAGQSTPTRPLKRK
jgi:hypothetical protein